MRIQQGRQTAATQPALAFLQKLPKSLPTISPGPDSTRTGGTTSPESVTALALLSRRDLRSFLVLLLGSAVRASAVHASAVCASDVRASAVHHDWCARGSRLAAIAWDLRAVGARPAVRRYLGQTIGEKRQGDIGTGLRPRNIGLAERDDVVGSKWRRRLAGSAKAHRGCLADPVLAAIADPLTTARESRLIAVSVRRAHHGVSRLRGVHLNRASARYVQDVHGKNPAPNEREAVSAGGAIARRGRVVGIVGGQGAQ